ncbi:MAG: hypothetical protein ABFS05_13285, partial [Bacteroidota bacterium]
MKNITNTIILIIVSFVLLSCTQQPKPECEKESFSFAFMTDIHLQPEQNAVEGFRAAITEVNALKPE